MGNYYSDKADRSDENAKRNNIDPPSSERKTFEERYNETNAMSTDAIKWLIARREAEGKECGVLYRVMSERT